MVAIVGEADSGKHKLGVLGIAKAKRRPTWLNNPRLATEEQACILLEALVRSVGEQLPNLPFRESCDAAAEQFRGALVVIEDLPRVVPRGPLAIRIEALARRLRSVDAYLFMTTYFRLPPTTEQAPGRSPSNAPRFTNPDLPQLLPPPH